jgi:hypothetical protein
MKGTAELRVLLIYRCHMLRDLGALPVPGCCAGLKKILSVVSCLGSIEVT